MTPLNQLRLRLPAHDFDRLMQAAKPVAESDRDALLKDIAAELGQHEVIGPGLLHRIISEVQRRYDVVDQRGLTTSTIGWSARRGLGAVKEGFSKCVGIRARTARSNGTS